MTFQTNKIADNQTLMKYEFNSINDLLDYIESHPINKDIFPDNKIYSELISPNYCGGVKSVAEAIKLCRYGVDIQSIKEFIKINKLVEDIVPVYHQKRNVDHNLYGFRPDVIKSMRGNPKSMYHLKRNEPKIGLNLLMFPNATLRAVPEQITNLGICVIQTVKLLEMVGYDVSCYFLDLSYMYKSQSNILDGYYEEYLLTQVKIKDDSEIFNPAISYFPLCHPAFIRRIMLRLTEEAPVTIKEWGDTSGTAIEDLDEMNKFLHYFSSYHTNNKKIVINYDVYKNCIKGDNILEDFKSFLKYIDLEKYLTKNQQEEFNQKRKRMQF